MLEFTHFCAWAVFILTLYISAQALAFSKNNTLFSHPYLGYLRSEVFYLPGVSIFNSAVV